MELKGHRRNSPVGSRHNAGSGKQVARPSGLARTGSFQPNAYSVNTGSPEMRDPLFSPEAFYLMNNDRKTINRWIRYYDTYHPIVPNSLDIHALFPISDFSFKGVNDPTVSQFYDYVKNDVLKLLNWVILISSEYERLGEAFTFFAWDNYNGYYNSATILNPDLLEVYPFDWQGERKFVISMDIPETFQHLRDKKDVDSRYRKLWNALDPVIRRCIEGGLKIPLNPANVFGMQRLAYAYDVRGTSQVTRILKDLMHEDKLREAQMAVADGHITPYQIWKIGNSANGYIPTNDEIADWDNLLARAEHQNLFRIVTHADVTYETKGVGEGLLNISEEMKTIEDRILTALYTSRAMTTGEGPCVTPDTEVLTEEGFKFFPDVTVADRVASVNPETHEIEYCNPKEILCFDVTGDMRHFRGIGLDHLTTPNHRCLVSYDAGRTFDVVIADQVVPGAVFLSISPSGKKEHFVCTDVDRPNYTGKVYSMDLPPNRLYVSRRNGKICVTGNTYSNAIIGLKILEGRYQNKLYRIAAIIRSLFTKIAEANGFYSITPAQLAHGIRPAKNDRKLMLPTVHWDNYFSFSKDIDRAKFYLTLADAHRISYRRVLEILGLNFEEEQEVMKKDMTSLFEKGIYDKAMSVLTGAKENPGSGVPTDLTAPPDSGEASASEQALNEVGAEVPDGGSAPPLPTIDI